LLGLLAVLVAAAGCGGGGSSSATPPATLLCNANSQGTELARPAPAQTAVPTTTSTIEIVDDGQAD